VTKSLRFELVPGWEQLPPEYSHRDVCGVAVDGDDRVYLLTRHVTRVLVYERDGRFVTAWGGEIFTDRTHGLRFAPDGHLYTVDDGTTPSASSPPGTAADDPGHAREGLRHGYDESCWGRDTYKGTASIRRGGPPFNKPTGVAIAPMATCTSVTATPTRACIGSRLRGR